LLDEADLTANGVAILEGVSLQISARRRVALVGRSGSGKTSALHALLHFVECSSGRAAIGGIDVRHMTRSDIAQHVGWMGEETHVFALSLGDNLRLGQPSASDDECIAALDRVGLETWFVALPVGLDTMFGAGGRPLSAGERQRLGMARAIVAGGSVLLLDEPTAHIDPSSKGRVLSELMGAAGQRSILVVSHEPDIDRFVDEVVILEGGRVVSPSSQLDPAEPPRNPKSRSTSPFRGLS
jgi:ABC-type transport system involved in cytochrome bd biosynthesis fused ATPase/permease subunit